ncbi:UNVERIFIED_CONTAM: hypothetical protein FKN15_016663 [Acipenser sinensis]
MDTLHRVNDAEKLGLTHFPPVEAPNLALLSNETACPNKQCRVSEVIRKRAYSASVFAELQQCPDSGVVGLGFQLGIPIGNLGTLQAGLDPSLAALGGIASQPPLMGNVDPSKIDEIRRTVYVGNLNSQTTSAEQLLEYFKQVGDVKFVRMAGDETQPTRFAFVEFADQESVQRALTFNGVVFGDRPLKINHSNNAIVKPPEMTAQAAAKELEDVMKRVREAQSCISAAIEPVESGKSSTTSSKKAGRSRSRSQSKRKRSRSRHR